MPRNIDSERNREQRLRRRLDKQDFVLHKSRVRRPHLDDRGGYRILDLYGNYVIAGARFDLDLDDVEEIAAHWEAMDDSE